MADILDYLASLNQDQDYYNQHDPFFQSGTALGASKLPAPTTNAEALLGPLAQAIVSGGLTGYGKARAANTAYDVYQKSPMVEALGVAPQIGPLNPDNFSNGGEAYEDLLDFAKTPDYQKMLAHDYSGERPDGWTADVGKADFMEYANEKNQKDRLMNSVQEALYKQLADENPEAAAALLKKMGFDIPEIPKGQTTSRELREAELELRRQTIEETKGRKDAETSFPGYEYDKSKVRPTSYEAAKVRSELENNAVLKNALETLGTNIDKNGFMQVFDNNAQLQQALQSFIFNTHRKATGSGARLEGPEAKMIQAMTPAVAAGDFGAAIAAALLGRDPAQLARDMIRVVDKSQDAMMKARYGAKRVVDDVVSGTGAESPNIDAIAETFRSANVSEKQLIDALKAQNIDKNIAKQVYNKVFGGG